MNRTFSIYLDLVRFSAACLVYLWHSNQRWLVSDKLPASLYGHSAVVVFFVLSGFVIAYISSKKENTLLEYSASRLARVYSVVIPAIILTVVLDYFGRLGMPQVYGYPFGQFPIRILASALFCNEIWFISITSFSNVPFWSICYEFWYYVFFGIITFVPNRKWSYGGIALLALFLGPKIILLAPIWALGVVLFRWRRLTTISMTLSWIMFIGGAVGIVLFHWFDIAKLVGERFESLIGVDLYTNLTFSKYFPSDYILGPLIFVHFAGARNALRQIAPVVYLFERPIRLAASYTFSLYLLHQPLFLFWGAMLKGNPNGHVFWATTTMLVAVSVVLIGFFTENKRYLLKKIIIQLLMRFSFASPAPSKMQS